MNEKATDRPHKRKRALVIGLMMSGMLMLAMVMALLLAGDIVGVGMAQLYLPARFRDVEHISPEAAHRMFLQNSEVQAKTVFLDVRTAEEWAVSHIPGAEHCPEDSFPPGDELMEKLKQAEAVVVYCAAGYRSARVCQRLADKGFTQVHNMNGSIFAWANQGFPITGEKVHPYMESSAWMLKSELRP
jgi:rhodanese-related sulfurtransferase